MPNYVDYSTFNEINAPEEDRLMQDAFTRAEEASLGERQALGRVKNEAAGSYDQFGRVVGDTANISETASYTDYLQAKKQAQQARASVMGADNSADWRRQGVREGAMGRSGLDERTQQMGASAMANENQAQMQAQAGFQGRQQQASDAKAKREADWQAGQDRTKRDADWRAAWEAENKAKKGNADPGTEGLANFLNMDPLARFGNWLGTGEWEITGEGLTDWGSGVGGLFDGSNQDPWGPLQK